MAAPRVPLPSLRVPNTEQYVPAFRPARAAQGSPRRDDVRPAAMLAPQRHVVALIKNVRSYERLGNALLGRAPLERVPDWTRLLCRVAEHRFAIVVLDLFADLPHTTDFATRALAVSRDVARLILLCKLDLAAIEAVFRLPPCADGLIVLGVHDDATIRKRVLADVSLENADAHIRRLLEGRVSRAVAPHLSWCLSSLESPGERRLTVDDMARHASKSRTFLDGFFTRNVGSTPRLLIQLVYALVAVALSEDRQRSVARLAEELRFSSAGSLCRSIRQATGVSIAQVREAGGTTFLADLFAQRFGPVESEREGAIRLGAFDRGLAVNRNHVTHTTELGPEKLSPNV